jgi:hypothetical protein
LISLATPLIVTSAATAATVEVKGSDTDGRPVAGASVSLVPSNRQ